MADTIESLLTNWGTTNKPFTKDRANDLFNVEVFKSVRTLNLIIPLLVDALNKGSVRHQEFVQQSRVISTSSSGNFDYTKQGLYTTQDQIQNINYVEWVIYLGESTTDGGEVFGRLTVSLDDSSTKFDCYEDPTKIIMTMALGGGLPIHLADPTTNTFDYVSVARKEKSKFSLGYVMKSQLTGNSITFPTTDSTSAYYLFLNYRVNDFTIYQFVVGASGRGFFGIHVITTSTVSSFVRFATGSDITDLTSSLSSLTDIVSNNFTSEQSDMSLVFGNSLLEEVNYKEPSLLGGIDELGTIGGYSNPYIDTAASLNNPDLYCLDDYSNISDTKLPSEALNQNDHTQVYVATLGDAVVDYIVDILYYYPMSISNHALYIDKNGKIYYGQYLGSRRLRVTGLVGTGSSSYNYYGSIPVVADSIVLSPPNVANGSSNSFTLGSGRLAHLFVSAVANNVTMVSSAWVSFDTATNKLNKI